MASLSYLWANRAKFPFGSGAFFRAWGKRILSFPEVLGRNNERRRLVRQGAKIDPRAEIYLSRIDGKKSNLTIGAFTNIGKAYMALHTNVTIGEKVCINDHVEILTASHDVTDPEWKHIKKEIIIEDYAWIGTGAMILPGVRIGKGAVVGARAVVTKSVEPGTIVAGNPAKVVSVKRPEQLTYNPCEFLASNRSWLVG